MNFTILPVPDSEQRGLAFRQQKSPEEHGALSEEIRFEKEDMAAGRRSGKDQRRVPKKKSAMVPGPECVPMTGPQFPMTKFLTPIRRLISSAR